MPNDVYELGRQQFAEKELVDLTLAVVVINGWNRLAIAFKIMPGTFQLGVRHSIGHSLCKERTARLSETRSAMITLKRAYDPVSRDDGTRVLVERLWPRGVSKAKLRVEAWLKEVGPSTELRKWFGHDPEKWPEFRRRYFRELSSRPEAWQPIVAAARRGTVTLVYSSHDTQHNNAVALQEYLPKKARRPARSTRASAPGRPGRLLR